MLARIRKSLARYISEPIAALLVKTGISPNGLTIFGFCAILVVAWVLSTGRFFLGGFLVLFAGSLDFLDGALARATGRSTTFGAFLDSTLDRFSDAALFLGLLAYYGSQGSYHQIMLVGAALMGSLITSYARARAEGLGLRDEVGIFTRTERIVLLAIGLIINQMTVVLWIIAVLSNFTALQRIYHVWRQTVGKC